MATNIPSQIRLIDPFFNFNSDEVNKHTKSLTFDYGDGLLTSTYLDITIDSTNTHYVNLSPGFVIKDNVLIQITNSHIVDFSDSEHYYSTIIDPPNEGGYYYIVLDYKYEKVTPAPSASIKILTPSEISTYSSNDNLFLLKVALLDDSTSHNVVELYNSDPLDDTIKREFLKTYVSPVGTLPDFSKERDQGRICYNFETDTFYFGYSTQFIELSSGRTTISLTSSLADSTSVIEGMVCYLNYDGFVSPAIADMKQSGADLIVYVSDELATNGLIFGYTDKILIESGVTINAGDLLYLSKTEEGKVTNIRGYGFYQVVGRALTSGSNSIEAIFSPKIHLTYHLQDQISNWNYDFTSNYYYYDIDMAPLNLDSEEGLLTAWFDDNTSKQVTPNEIKILDQNTLRVSFDTTGLVINYIISNGVKDLSDSKKAKVITNHSLFYNLDYVNSGHTGFSPSPHNNDYHSQIYVTETDVNYTNLNVNGSVGTGANQVAAGNHTHPEYADVPVSEIILFESDTVRPGYTLLTSLDDQLVYITKGSAALGEAGATTKSGSTWTQPSHSHSINSDGAHIHTTESTILTISQLPAHTHTYEYGPSPGMNIKLTSSATYYFGQTAATKASGSAGGGLGHDHGVTGSSGDHNHTGTSNTSTTSITWRPRGINYTRQQRI